MIGVFPPLAGVSVFLWLEGPSSWRGGRCDGAHWRLGLFTFLPFLDRPAASRLSPVKWVFFFVFDPCFVGAMAVECFFLRDCMRFLSELGLGPLF